MDQAEEIEIWKKKIDEMSQMDMARFYRFTTSGHIVFRSDLPLHSYFEKRFEELGGMTPSVSKAIGW